MNKKCYIVGAGDNSGTNFHKEENEYVIAADGGYEILNEMGITPDLVIGDFDSLGYIPSEKCVIKLPVEKDDTDMMICIKKAVELGYRDIELYGGTGGRIDHTIANWQAMLWASRQGCNISMTDSKNIFIVITDRRITLPAQKGGDLSVFAIGGDAVGVSILGGKYVAKDMMLTEDNPTAVSNSFMGNNITISVESGSLLIVI